ncbi:hypothetical protein LQE92_08690 [Lacrimispora sp. NSJ-141]|uniref:Uncharacterized protein n=1 Tax=Lientehia hominis TaxID=2897778 RepID=A0AAP2RI87_9FIRM|nr:hypothetical protein [Lientehia hominis]MCD2492704.1 hypothetical protein [Lientehia hominis]
MLGKLLKYDYRSNLYYFLLMYAVFIGITFLARVSISMVDIDYPAFDNDVLSMMTVMGSVVMYFIGCGALMVLTYLMIAMRFYKNLMGNEGYLSFTLPVSYHSHLISKIISGVTLLIVSFVILALSGVILTAGTDMWGYPMVSFAERLFEAVKLYNPFIAILYVLNGLVSVIQMVLVIYFSICVGQLVSKHRVLAAIGIYIGTNIVLGMISALGSTIFISLLDGSYGSTLYFTVTNLASILFKTAVAAGGYIGSYCILKHRLNLE